MAEGLIDGAAFAVDGSLIAADANKQRSAAGSDEVDWQALARTRRSVEATRAIRQAEVGAARTMIERTEERLGLVPSAWPPIVPMARRRCWDGWSTSGRSSRTFRCSTSRPAPTPFGGSIPPAPASHSLNQREWTRIWQKAPQFLGFSCGCLEVSGLSNTATLARIRRKSPARTAEIPVFVETIGGDRFDHY